MKSTCKKLMIVKVKMMGVYICKIGQRIRWTCQSLNMYIDDIVAVSNNPSMLKAEKAALCMRFKMIDQV